MRVFCPVLMGVTPAAERPSGTGGAALDTLGQHGRKAQTSFVGFLFGVHFGWFVYNGLHWFV